MGFAGKGLSETIPPAWKREKNEILDRLYEAEDALTEYRRTQSGGDWENFKNYVVSAYLRLRTKTRTIRKKGKKPKYEFKGIDELLFNTSEDQPTEENLQKWGKWLRDLADLAEATGITSVSVEDAEPSEAYKEGM